MTSRREFLARTGAVLGALALPSAAAKANEASIKKLDVGDAPVPCKGCINYDAISISMYGVIVGRVTKTNGNTFKNDFCDFVPGVPLTGQIWTEEVQKVCSPPCIHIMGEPKSDQEIENIKYLFQQVDTDPVGAVVPTGNGISWSTLNHYGPVTAIGLRFRGSELVYRKYYAAEILPYKLDTTVDVQDIQLVIHQKPFPPGAETW